MTTDTAVSHLLTMQDWPAVIAAMHSGQPFEMDEEVWYYWLEVLPPVYMNRVNELRGARRACAFGFAEGVEPITDFWQESGRYFGCRSNRINRGG